MPGTCVVGLDTRVGPRVRAVVWILILGGYGYSPTDRTADNKKDSLHLKLASAEIQGI